MRVTLPHTLQHHSGLSRTIPKGWYWLAALGLSLAMWWGLFRLASFALSALA